MLKKTMPCFFLSKMLTEFSFSNFGLDQGVCIVHALIFIKKKHFENWFKGNLKGTTILVLIFLQKKSKICKI